MRILSVIPISKGYLGEPLTYFTKEAVMPGALVLVPLRKQSVPALVAGSQAASELKAALRQSDFVVKKIDQILEFNFFHSAFLAAARETADYFAASLGPIIKTYTPQLILNQAGKAPSPQQKGRPPLPPTSSKRLKREDFVLQAPDDERISFYKSLIRESFAKGASVLCLLPTQPEIEKIYPGLSRGIEAYTIILHNELNKKELLNSWQAALEQRHPVLILATPLFLALPRTDIETYIVERESSENYKDRQRPFSDSRVFAQFLARGSGAKLIFGDLALRTETVFRAERGELSPIAPLKYRSFLDLKQGIIAVGANRQPGEGKKDWPAVSPELLERLTLSLKAGERAFILAGRRGLSPTTVCNDCGTVKVCRRCAKPLVLHQSKNRDGQNILVCHRCGALDNELDTCAQCGSWRLSPLGLGIEKIEKTLKKALPENALFRLDSDNIKNSRAARLLINQFLKTSGAILLGTEMALYYLNERVENTIALGLDSLLALPDFRISEKVFSLLLRTRSLASKQFIIETHHPEERIYREACQGNLLDFYRDELSERKALGWPPLSTLIKIETSGLRPRIDEVLHKTAAIFAPHAKNVHSLLSPAGRPRYFKATIILELAANQWIDDQILTLLRRLPPDWQINVDPESLF